MLSKYVRNVKSYYKQPKKHLLNINVNLTASKATLKYIEHENNPEWLWQKKKLTYVVFDPWLINE